MLPHNEMGNDFWHILWYDGGAIEALLTKAQKEFTMTSKKVDAFLYGSIAAVTVAALGLSSFMSIGNGERFKALMLLTVFLAFLWSVTAVRLKWSGKHIFYAVLIAGMAMRVGYTIYTAVDMRQHDVWTTAEPGHWDYIAMLYEKGRLPDSFAGQYYHGPLSHAMIALFIKLVSLTGIDPLASGASWLQAVPCVLSCFTIVIAWKIARELGLGERACLTVELLVAFHPVFYMLSGSVNNDMVMIFFFFLGILYTVRYFNRPAMKHILMLAAAIGCAMMSKLSGGMIAFFTGPVFLMVLVNCIRQNRFAADATVMRVTVKQLTGQFAAFLAVCAPLGLWHSARNLIVLGQPLGYVPAPPVDGDLYVGQYGFQARFLSFPLSKYFGSWCNPREDYNLWTYMLKSGIFGEWEFDVPVLPADSLLLLFLLLTLVSAFWMLRYIQKREAHPILRCGFLILTVTQLFSYLQFNIAYPFGCTMDFRYIVPLVMPFSVYAALAAEDLSQETAWWKKAASSVLYSVIGGFCALSVLFYVIL